MKIVYQSRQSLRELPPRIAGGTSPAALRSQVCGGYTPYARITCFAKLVPSASCRTNQTMCKRALALAVLSSPCSSMNGAHNASRPGHRGSN
jgi:hypothetical protein